VGLANLGRESETCVGSCVHLVGVSISFEKKFYRLPYTPPLSGSPYRSFTFVKIVTAGGFEHEPPAQRIHQQPPRRRIHPVTLPRLHVRLVAASCQLPASSAKTFAKIVTAGGFEHEPPPQVSNLHLLPLHRLVVCQ
jgi:hypothetical protein